MLAVLLSGLKPLLEALRPVFESLFKAFAGPVVEVLSAPDTEKILDASLVPELRDELNAQLDRVLAGQEGN